MHRRNFVKCTKVSRDPNENRIRPSSTIEIWPYSSRSALSLSLAITSIRTASEPSTMGLTRRFTITSITSRALHSSWRDRRDCQNRWRYTAQVTRCHEAECRDPLFDATDKGTSCWALSCGRTMFHSSFGTLNTARGCYVVAVNGYYLWNAMFPFHLSLAVPWRGPPMTCKSRVREPRREELSISRHFATINAFESVTARTWIEDRWRRGINYWRTCSDVVIQFDK